MKENTNNEHCLPTTTFTIAAKSFVGIVRDNNEDDFQCSSDLENTTMKWNNNETCTLSDKGALLVVADGMGGMNAGEVASKTAIDTVKDCFKPEKITADVLRTRYTIERFMNNVVTEADNRIKQTAKECPETKGMGTTIVMGWINGGYLYVSWCGDSRAYVFNPTKGLKRLSKDHSLVQELVDSGKISKEDAFDYPDSNVITNCLSAVAQKAEPSVLAMPHKLEQDDVILLCSDGLCGLIRDTEIQGIIDQNFTDMAQCCDALIKAACDAGGHDNVTVALCKMVSVEESEPNSESAKIGKKTWIKWGVASALALLIGIAIWYFCPKENNNAADNQQNDTTAQNNPKDSTEKEQNLNNDLNTTGETKPPKYICGDITSDNVIAELKKSHTLRIVVDTYTEYVYEKFPEPTDTDTLVGCSQFKGENHHYHFNTKDFAENNTINGRIEIKDKATPPNLKKIIQLNNVPVTKEEEQGSQNGAGEGSFDPGFQGGLQKDRKRDGINPIDTNKQSQNNDTPPAIVPGDSSRIFNGQ